ncbi:MAG: hypothetical protein SCALA702_33580 [Melioribacteraceae bacterium]|nr:MAG: hypothetical protein SCALA702_33580 [Melioribacteraceae bacterium]
MNDGISGNIKILIVDDKPENLSVLFQLLSMDYEVLAAENGKIAMEIINESHPDLVILDIMMPVMDGYQVINAIREDGKTKNLPVIFMSALSETVDKIRGLKLGANDYITKPFNAEEVMLRVNTQVKIISYQKELEKLNNSLESLVQERTSELNDNLRILEDVNQELQFSEKRYRVLFEDAPDAIVLLDINTGKVVDVNPAAANLFGVKISELIGRDQKDIFQNTEENVQRNISVVNSTRVLQRPTHRLFSNLIVRPDGIKIPVESTARTIFIEGNLYLQGIMRDISERKIVEEQLKLAKEKAEEMSRIKSNFLANMSHELRTPLISILGFSQFLVEELTDSELQGMAEIVNKGGNRLLDTLNLLLDISQIESGKISINESLVDINQTIFSVIDSYHKLAIEKNLIFTEELSEDILTVKADENMLLQIIEKLLDNAIKFTKEGSVKIKSGKKTNGEKQYCFVEISDSGIGINPEKLGFIFQEFRQASEGATRDFEGIGLGVTISKRFIEYLGGYLDVSSIPDQGSTFTVNLPIASSNKNLKTKIDHSLHAGNENKMGYNSGKPRLLYLEDDFATREFAKLILEKEFELDAFESTDDVLQSLKNNSYDLFLIDVNLGNGESGLQILSALNHDNHYKNVPKVAVTAFAMKGDEENLIHMGFTHYLSKPFDKKGLLHLVKTILD